MELVPKPVQIGKRFRALMGRQPHWFAVFRCKCQSTFVARLNSVVSGKTKSCGCYRREIRGEKNRTHGMSNSKAYSVWAGMHQRCENESRWNFDRYGGRGITVCDRWKSFEAFYEDMGDPPAGKTLDRVDNEEGYSADNCKWSTVSEQNSNKRSKVTIKVIE